MCQEYSIGNKYLIIMKQRIQTTDNIVINRLEIGRVIKDATKVLWIETKSGVRWIKKTLIAKVFDISNMDYNLQKYLNDLEGALI